MRWWVRLLVTLLAAPLLWRLGIAYLAVTQQGANWGDLLRQSVDVLASIYLAFTLPALVLCAILAGADVVLHKLGLDLLSILVSPLLAWGVAAILLHVVPQQGVANAEAVMILAVAYGLVWGLAIREQRHRRAVRLADAPPSRATDT